MTSSVSYAAGQQIYIDPYNGKLFDFNSHQSRVYLGRSINQLLNVFGDNCIIDGLKINHVTLEDNKLLCAISPGKVIIDTTLIEFPTEIILETDVSTVDGTSGFFIVSIAYSFLQDTYENKAKFRLSFVKTIEQEVPQEFVTVGYCPDFYPELDKIVLTIIDINKLNSTVSYVPSYYTNTQLLIINGVTYKVFPSDSITKSVIKAIQEIFFI